jgi:SIR2-like protein
MSRCYVLGAGFSKAVAHLPLMKGMVKEFTKRLEQERALGDTLRVGWGERLLSDIQHLERKFFREPYVDTKNGQTYENCNFSENFEALVSYIDLNLSGRTSATLVDVDGKKSNFTTPSLFGYPTNLDELRLCIQTYLYLVLIGPFPESPLLRLFIEQLAPDDRLITFNYDLVVETALYTRRLWNPSDGYGLEFKATKAVSESNMFKTKIPLYKLHGSLNWERSALQLSYFYNDYKPIFPGYLDQDEDHPSVPYQGKIAGSWLMPSFIKDFSVPALLTVWTKAFDAVRRAEEVIIIGYSLPEADAAACLLFGTSGISDKRLMLVNPDANLRDRYRSGYPKY